MGAEDSPNRWRRRVEEPEAHSSCLGVLQLQLRKAGRGCWYRRIRLRRISLEWPPHDRSQQQKQEQLEHHGFILRLLTGRVSMSCEGIRSSRKNPTCDLCHEVHFLSSVSLPWYTYTTSGHITPERNASEHCGFVSCRQQHYHCRR